MRVGILIIGSLLWDNRDDGARATWRQNHLRVGEARHVKVPIRYGRLSTGPRRGNTFTMTLEADGPCGQGTLVPCAAIIQDAAGLIAEAEALWKAESGSEGRISASWGCVGALFRAASPPPEWVAEWTTNFREKKSSSIPPVNADGLLPAGWPERAGGSLPDVDVVLAAAAKAKQPRSTVEEIADAWIDQNGGHEHYFFKNVRNDIRTPDDGLIWKRIKQREPSWLKNPSYSQEVSLLEKEAGTA